MAVAVKVLKSDVIKKQEIYEDFVREVEAMHSLQHPSLIRSVLLATYFHKVVIYTRFTGYMELCFHNP